tara:strand:+ start:1137 stop:1250 length:114 start_codon:yes stop_codon:yes gene_type:complete
MPKSKYKKARKVVRKKSSKPKKPKLGAKWGPTGKVRK